jgi:hypothetical protein
MSEVRRQMSLCLRYTTTASWVANTQKQFFLRAMRQIELTADMVGLGGLEPPTSRLSGVRSNQLSYRPPWQQLF